MDVVEGVGGLPVVSFVWATPHRDSQPREGWWCCPVL